MCDLSGSEDLGFCLSYHFLTEVRPAWQLEISDRAAWLALAVLAVLCALRIGKTRACIIWQRPYNWYSLLRQQEVASLAQLVEHRSRKAGVISSSLIAGSIEINSSGGV